eukprot:917705-Pleurochrysis_carterae.AAC.1
MMICALTPTLPPGPPWVRQHHQMIYRFSTEQLLKVRARIDSVARTNSFNHARLSWRALEVCFSIHRELPEQTSEMG